MRIKRNFVIGHLSSSVDNLSPKLKIRALKKPEIKPVLPPTLNQQNNDTWKIDNGWKFMRELQFFCINARFNQRLI